MRMTMVMLRMLNVDIDDGVVDDYEHIFDDV